VRRLRSTYPHAVLISNGCLGDARVDYTGCVAVVKPLGVAWVPDLLVFKGLSLDLNSCSK
jgi:hypothetical protein